MSKPYLPAGTNKRFYVPPTLASDFTEFLDNDIPNTVMNFKLYHNWYEKRHRHYLLPLKLYQCSGKHPLLPSV